MPTYLDCNATTPIEPRVAEIVRAYTEEEFGNAGSRTHEFGNRAKQAVQTARKQIAAVLPGVDAADVVFTSGATESNNLAILGLLKWAEENNKNHIVTTAIEHKAVAEPVEWARTLGFDITYVSPNESGAVQASEVIAATRKETCLVSVMHVNNETGIIQPIDEIAEGLQEQGCYFHTDAAQGFGKALGNLNHPRIDLISISSHKVYGPKGVGVLIMRRRKFKRAPLAPLMFGGGQERGLRPGTLPVALIAGFGLAAELCQKDCAKRDSANRAFRETLKTSLEGIDYEVNGDESLSVPHTLNLSFPGLNSEAVMLALKGVIAISNGSACTSQSYEPSHVLTAMGLPKERIESALRLSWCHMTEKPDLPEIQKAIKSLL